MIVLKTDTPFDQLPVSDAGDPPAPVTSGANKVDEANNVGETGDPNLQPGETRTFTVKLDRRQVRPRVQPRRPLPDGHARPVHGDRRRRACGHAAQHRHACSSADTGANGPMSLTPSSSVGAAGDITFTVTNTGTVEHEMIILKTDTPFDQLPVTDAGDPPAPVTSGANKVDEANNVGETGDPNLQPGETRTFTVKLDRRQVRPGVQPRRPLPDGHARPLHGPMTDAEPNTEARVTADGPAEPDAVPTRARAGDDRVAESDRSRAWR